MSLCTWHTFWIAPCLICYFIVILFYSRRKRLFMTTWATTFYDIFPLKSKLSGKFKRFNAVDEELKWWKIVEYQKTSLKMKSYQILYEGQTASHLKEVIQPRPKPPPSDKTLRLWNKSFLTEIYRNIKTFAIKVLQECRFLGVKKWCSANVFS